MLFVDDDVYSLEGIKAGLSFDGMEVGETFWVTSMKAACSVLRDRRIDIMVCDIEMPGGSGIDLLQWLEEEHISVVTIFLTCFSNFEYAHQAIRYHVFDYILKPVRCGELAEKIEKAIQERKKALFLEETLETEFKDLQEDSVITRMKDYIEQNLASELTRKEISGHVFLNPDYAARIFRNAEGVTLKEYIRNRRINRVKKLLICTAKPMDVICSETGFSYNSYFYNTFKEVEGMTPQEYRKKFQNLKDIKPE